MKDNGLSWRIGARVRNWLMIIALKNKALIVVLLGVFSIAGACDAPEGRQRDFLPRSPITHPIQPPQESLILWLEGEAPGGGSYLRNGSNEASNEGLVTEWVDRRGGETNVVAFRPNFEGRRVDIAIRTRNGTSVTVPALRCGDTNNSSVRCSYMFSDSTAPSAIDLDTTPYTILAVVRRNSSRGDNYFFVSTNGTNCSALAGGTGCASNSALHVGWSGERTARLGQYDNDSVLDPVPAFGGEATPVSLFVARSGPGFGKQVALLEPGFNFSQTVRNTDPLSNSGALFVGGTPWSGLTGRNVPDWRFVGDIIAVLVYRKALSDAEKIQPTDYLRNRYAAV